MCMPISLRMIMLRLFLILFTVLATNFDLNAKKNIKKKKAPQDVTYKTKSNIGDWLNSSTWDNWETPSVDVNVGKKGRVIVNGKITIGSENSSESLTIVLGKLIVQGVLVIYGDLDLEESASLEIKDQGKLIVLGSVKITKKVVVKANGDFVVQDDFIVARGQGNGGGGASLTSNDKPANVFIGGDISVPGAFDMAVLENKDSPHGSSKKNYGDFVDLKVESPTLFGKYFGFNGGEIVSNLIKTCGVSEVVFTEKTAAGPGKIKFFEWRYSYTDPSSNPPFNFGTKIENTTEIKCVASLSKTYYCWRYVAKNNSEANSNVIKIIVNPKPKPIGIFFE